MTTFRWSRRSLWSAMPVHQYEDVAHVIKIVVLFMMRRSMQTILWLQQKYVLLMTSLPACL